MLPAFFFWVTVIFGQPNNMRESVDSSLHRRDDSQVEKRGFAFGSPSKYISTYVSLDTDVFLIPPYMFTNEGENVTRPAMDMPKGDDTYVNVTVNGSQFGEDPAWLNGFQLENFSVDPRAFNPYFILAGLCLLGNESVISTNLKVSVLDSLFDSGYIDTRSFSYSVYNATDILFGQVDHGKYEQPLVKFKHHSEASQDRLGLIHPTLLMDGISGTNFLVYNPIPVQMTGYMWQLPYQYTEPLYDHFRKNYDMDYDGFLPCLAKNLSEYISFYFSGEEFRVPVPYLIGQRNSSNASTTCYLIIDDTYSEAYQVGWSLFYDKYVVVDYDNEEIAFARNVSESKPETIQNISTGIPLSRAAKYFYYSSLKEKTVTRSGRTYVSTSLHPTYSMYTGDHFDISSTRSSQSRRTAYSTRSTSGSTDSTDSTTDSTDSTTDSTDSTTDSITDSVTSDSAGSVTFAPTGSAESTSSSTSSSSSAGGNYQKAAGLSFLALLLSVLPIL